MNSGYNERASILAQQQAQMNQFGTREVTVKDPTVSDAQDAIAALRKRRESVVAELAKVPRLEAELARIDRMLAAAATPEVLAP